MSKTNYAYHSIKEKILSGEFPAEKELSEKELQSTLNVSRTPIREAFQMLQREGFIIIHPRKSIMVAPITVELLTEIYDTRIMLEPLLFKRACGRISDAKLMEFRKALLFPPGDMKPEEQCTYYNIIDKEFHRCVLPYANNRFLAEAMSTVLDHEERLRNTLFNIETNDAVVEEHISIINALLERSEDVLEEQVHIHVQNAKKKAFRYFFN